MILTFKTDVPLELTMMFEECYEPELQMDIEEKREVCKHAAWLYAYGVIAAEIYGAAIKDVLEEKIPDCDKELPDTIYCYSVTVLPKYRKKGLASILHAYWMGMLQGNTIVGHATSEEMVKLAVKFGAVFFGPPHKNWYGTNRTAYFYRIQRQ